MTIHDFIDLYREAFGDGTPLPVAFGYSHTPMAEVGKVPRCMVGAIRKVCDGKPLTLTRDNVLCGGGKLYTAFAPMPERVPTFVSEVEHYKQTKEQVTEYVGQLGIKLTDKPYLNFARLDSLDSLDGVEAIVIFANPDVLSGLCSWAFYDNNAHDAVCTLFGSGCSSIVTMAAKENERGGRSCFIGMLDPSARLLIPHNELTFAIPTSRLHEMMGTMRQSSLFQKAYTLVKKRIVKGFAQEDV